MTKVLWALSPVLAAVAVWGVASHQDTARQLKVSGGHSTVSFFPGILDADKLVVKTTRSADPDVNTAEKSVGFEIGGSDLQFMLDNGKLTKFVGGKLTHGGGFVLTNGKRQINADQFMVTPSKNVNDGLELWVDSDRESYMAFQLVHMRTMYLPKTRQIVFGGMDVELSLAGAQHLGKPELAGQVVGSMNIYADADPSDGKGDVVVTDEGSGSGSGSSQDSVLDVSISNLQSLTYMGHIGTFPTGMAGFSMSTTSCNVGTLNIPWSAPMQVQHPVIAMNLYRVKDGKFEQIGWSWLKHGFFATNSSGCGSCQNPGTGSLLGPGCSDTYGVSNNSDRFYLGGRDEVNPFTGVWTCQNSYFSNYVNDCVRRNNGSGLDAVAHRLAVADADLNGQTGAQYYYEAYYISANDFDRYNNVASREATIAWNGSSYNVNTTGTFAQGIALDRWGTMRNFAEPRDEGDVKVAVLVTDLGNGMWHYEYAAYNHTLDRQVRTFSIPVPAGSNIQNVGFHDIDQDSGNDWTSSFSNGALTWSTGTEGSTNPNPLKYASLFNFRFDCNVPPANSLATLGMFKAGNGDTKAAYITGPTAFQPLASYQRANSYVFAGDLQSLSASDDNRLTCGPQDTGSRSGSGIEGTITAPATTINSITVDVESSNTKAGATQIVQFYNWSSNLWETVDTRATTLTDSIATFTVTSNLASYLDPNGTVKIKVLHIAPIAPTGNRWTLSLDQVGLRFN